MRILMILQGAEEKEEQEGKSFLDKRRSEHTAQHHQWFWVFVVHVVQNMWLMLPMWK